MILRHSWLKQLISFYINVVIISVFQFTFVFNSFHPSLVFYNCFFFSSFSLIFIVSFMTFYLRKIHVQYSIPTQLFIGSRSMLLILGGHLLSQLIYSLVISFSFLTNSKFLSFVFPFIFLLLSSSLMNSNHHIFLSSIVNSVCLCFSRCSQCWAGWSLRNWRQTCGSRSCLAVFSSLFLVVVDGTSWEVTCLDREKYGKNLNKTFLYCGIRQAYR